MEINFKNYDGSGYNTIRDVLKKEFNISNSLITKLKKHEAILLNGTFSYVDKKIFEGDIVSVNFDYDEKNDIVPTKQELHILFEDEWLLVLSKPPGISVHPSIRHYENSLSNGVSYYYNEINLHKKIHIVNRLDLGTSGIVIFAKTEYIQEALKKQRDNKIFKKEYLAVLEGYIDSKTGTIDAPISRKENSIIERKIDFENGRKSISHYELIRNFIHKETNTKLSLVKYTLETRQKSSAKITFFVYRPPYTWRHFIFSSISHYFTPSTARLQSIIYTSNN